MSAEGDDPSGERTAGVADDGAARPLEPARLHGALGALADTAAAAAVVVVDLDRVHLVEPDGRQLARWLHTLGAHLDGRATWLRVDTDLVVVLVPAVASFDDTTRFVADLLVELDRARPGAARLTDSGERASESGDGLVRPSVGASWRPIAHRDQLHLAASAAALARRGGERWMVLDGSPASDGAAAPARQGRSADAALAAVAAVAAREPLDEFLVRASSAAMSQSPARFLSRLDSTLGEIGELLDLDYVFVDVLGADTETVSNFAGWCAPTNRGFIRTEPRRIAPDDPWYDVLHRMDPVVVDDQFATHAGHHPGNHPSGGVARAFVIVPFVVGNRLAGAVGGGTIERSRQWSEDEVTTLRLATGVIAGVIERNRAEMEHRVASR